MFWYSEAEEGIRKFTRNRKIYDTFAQLTRDEEEAGLLADTATIGTRDGWAQRLEGAGWRVEDYHLVRWSASGRTASEPPEVG